MTDKEEVARKLASWHFQIEPEMARIFALCDKPEMERLADAPIKLLTVNNSTSGTGVMPLYFGPAPASGMPFSSVILEVTPEEFERIQAHELCLPNGWEVGEEFLPEEG